MKFGFALLTLSIGSVVATAPLPIYGGRKGRTIEIGAKLSADSDMGKSLLAHARRLDNEEEADYSWLSGFSIKFQGCHHVSQWNYEANDQNDVKISTKRLARFRLCPSDSCSATDGAGCSAGYGDYVVDMNSFINSYIQNKENVLEQQCKYAEQYTCPCEDDGSDNFNRDYCRYDCYIANGLEDCVEQNPYTDDAKDESQFELDKYMECAEYKFQNNRRLENGDVAYYVGPYCADQGGKIFLGMFTDDACTINADDSYGKDLFLSMTTFDLPYSSESLIGMDCFSCADSEDENAQNENGAEDEDQVKEVCTNLYSYSGKCESQLGYASNVNGCNYIDGIKIVRKDGTIYSTSSASKNKVASAFIGIFAVSFILLGAYVYYLKTKMDRSTIHLSD